MKTLRREVMRWIRLARAGPRPPPSESMVATGSSRTIVGVEIVAEAGGAIDAPAVTEGGRQAGDEDVPVVAGAIASRMQGNFGHRRRAVQGIDDKKDCGAVPAQKSKVDPFGSAGRSQGQTATATDPQD